MQKRQQDADGLLLVPRQHHRQRQVVHAALECVGEGNGNLDGTVGVIALAHVHQARQAANCAQVEVVEAVLAARERQHDRVVGRGLDEVGVVVAARTCAIATGDQEEMLDGALLDRVDDRVGDREHRALREAGRHGRAAIDASEVLGLGIAAQLEGLLDDRREILVGADVRAIRERHHLGREHAIGIAVLRRHEAVRGVQQRAGDVVELLLLVLPGGAEVALEVRELLQLGIGVRRQHLAVGVDVDALALGLLEQQLQVVQVVTGHDDERAGLDLEGDGGGLGRAERAGVGGVEHRHAGEVHLADLQHEREQRVDGTGLCKRCERLNEERVDRLVVLAEHARMVGVGGNAANAEQHERLERADILVGAPHLGHVVVGLDIESGGGGDSGGFGVHFGNQRTNRELIEVHVGHAGEQSVHHELVRARPYLAGTFARAGQPNQRAGQLVLSCSHILGFPTNTRTARACLAFGRLLALEAKHLVGHLGSLSLVCLPAPRRIDGTRLR